MERYEIQRWEGGAVPVEADLLRQMQNEGYNVYSWSDGPGTLYPDHQHDDDQSHWVVSGCMKLTVAGVGTFEMRPGDRDFMPAGTVHAARVLGDGAVVYLIGSLTR